MGRDLASYDLRSKSLRAFSSAGSGAPPLELHPNTSMRLSRVGRACAVHYPKFILFRFDAPRIAADRSRTAPWRGLQIVTASRIAVLLGVYLFKHCERPDCARRAIHRTLGMRLERGCPASRRKDAAQRIRAQIVRSEIPPLRKATLPRVELHPEFDGWREATSRAGAAAKAAPRPPSSDRAARA
jgi:hypothetical protein